LLPSPGLDIGCVQSPNTSDVRSGNIFNSLEDIRILTDTAESETKTFAESRVSDVDVGAVCFNSYAVVAVCASVVS